IFFSYLTCLYTLCLYYIVGAFKRIILKFVLFTEDKIL
ncbi:unnamed protein product, partial [Larinioides sclopetarius]